MLERARVAGAVLAGGRGERLGGRLKALLPLGPRGEPLLRHVLALLEGLCDPVLVSSSRPLGDEARGRTVVPDAFPGSGPLGGLASVLAAAPRERVLVVAGDMPTLSPALLSRLVALALEHPEALAVVPRTADGRWHPLHAVYSRALLPELQARARDGRLALRDALEAAGALAVPEDELRRHDPALASLANVNTPEDLERALGPERARAALDAPRPRT